MKNKIIICLSLLLLVILSFSLNTKNKVHAAEAYQIEMVGGASLRFGDGGGFRFRCQMDKDTADALKEDGTSLKLHMYITLTTLYNESGNFKKIDIEIDPTKIYTEDAEPTDNSKYFANGCVINILESNRKKVYTACAAILDGSTTIYNSSPVANNSLYILLSKSTVYTEEDYASQIFTDECYNTWFGTKEFPIEVQNESEYNTVVNKKTQGSVPENAYIKIDGADFSSFSQEGKTKVENDPYTNVSRAIADIFSFGPGIETETVYVSSYTYTYGPSNTQVTINDATIAFPVVSLSEENATKYTSIQVGDKNVLVPYVKVHEYNGYYYFPVFTRLSIDDASSSIGYSTSSLPTCITTNAEEVLNIFNKGGQIKEPYGTGTIKDGSGNEIFCYTIKVPSGGYSQADLGIEKMLKCTYTTTIDGKEESILFFIIYTFNGEAYDDFE